MGRRVRGWFFEIFSIQYPIAEEEAKARAKPEKPCAFEKIHPGFGSLFEIQMHRYNPADAANAYRAAMALSRHPAERRYLEGRLRETGGSSPMVPPLCGPQR